jgi:hypothetical protein
MRDNLEKVLAGSADAEHSQHLAECTECQSEIAAMKEQAQMLQSLRAPSLDSPRAGFYARVMDRIESQGAVSIWSLFFDSAYGRRIAVASVALVLCLGVYMVTSEQNDTDEQQAVAYSVDASHDLSSIPEAVQRSVQLGSAQDVVLTGGPFAPNAQDSDSVLVNLVTYREQ